MEIFIKNKNSQLNKILVVNLFEYFLNFNYSVNSNGSTTGLYNSASLGEI